MEKPVTIIGIRFSDNDFINTIWAFLTCISETGIESYGDLNKEKIVELFNRSATGLYWLVQNRLRYPSTIFETLDPTYLTITTKNVFLNEEVTAYVKEKVWDNSEFHVLDTEIRGTKGENAPYIYSI